MHLKQEVSRFSEQQEWSWSTHHLTLFSVRQQAHARPWESNISSHWSGVSPRRRREVTRAFARKLSRFLSRHARLAAALDRLPFSR